MVFIAADSKTRSFSDPANLFWYQDFCGARGQLQVFMVNFGYVIVKFGLYKSYPLLYYT